MSLASGVSVLDSDGRRFLADNGQTALVTPTGICCGCPADCIPFCDLPTLESTGITEDLGGAGCSVVICPDFLRADIAGLTIVQDDGIADPNEVCPPNMLVQGFLTQGLSNQNPCSPGGGCNWITPNINPGAALPLPCGMPGDRWFDNQWMRYLHFRNPDTGAAFYVLTVQFGIPGIVGHLVWISPQVGLLQCAFEGILSSQVYRREFDCQDPPVFPDSETFICQPFPIVTITQIDEHPSCP